MSIRVSSGNVGFDKDVLFYCESSRVSIWKVNLNVTRYLKPLLIVVRVRQEQLVCFHLNPILYGSELAQEVFRCGAMQFVDFQSNDGVRNERTDRCLCCQRNY